MRKGILTGTAKLETTLYWFGLLFYVSVDSYSHVETANLTTLFS